MLFPNCLEGQMSGDTQYLWCYLHGSSLENQRYPLRIASGWKKAWIASLRNRVMIVSDRLKNFYAVKEYYFQGFF